MSNEFYSLESENTMFVSSIYPDKEKNYHTIFKKIPLPKKLIVIKDLGKNYCQVILDKPIHFTKKEKEKILGMHFIISNDPQQDPLGERTNLGYYSIKVILPGAQFVKDTRFNVFTKYLDKCYFRFNLPTRIPRKHVTGPNIHLFKQQGYYEVYIFEPNEKDKSILKRTKIVFTGTGGFRLVTEHDLQCGINGTEILEEYWYKSQEEFMQDIELKTKA